ncbi:hypothetical protein UCDDA912_g07975 [Diaporthe ampelina]|uniref:Uncharacterized protein n=1 Tax=Diaporthe ampelina TaxID=1214573 RepID=A0A0G2FBP7_9PEZI|nr:hypothetical protein UCDDA912_g07975 [Diaporthe ampelina]
MLASPRRSGTPAKYQIVQVAPFEFTVVDPHDFIEALSWSDSAGAQDAQVIRRIRKQTVVPNRVHRKLFIPFCVAADIFLAVVDLGATAFRILDQRTQEELRRCEKDDGFETSTFVYEFIRTLFPAECLSMKAWTILFERTAQGPVPLNEPGILSGRFVNEFGRHMELCSILPFFFEVIRIVGGTGMIRKTVVDDALLKRFFAHFEDSPRLKTTDIIERLRWNSHRTLNRLLEGQVRAVLKAEDVAFRNAVAATREDSAGHCTPPQLMHLKFRARNNALKAVERSHDVARDLMDQYAQIRVLLDGLTGRCMMARSAMHHAMLNSVAASWFYSPDARREVWEPKAALNQFRSQGLSSVAQRVQDMRTELDHWLGMLMEHLDTAKTE